MMTVLVGSSGAHTAGASDAAHRREQWEISFESVPEAKIGGHGEGEGQGAPCRLGSGGWQEANRGWERP